MEVVTMGRFILAAWLLSSGVRAETLPAPGFVDGRIRTAAYDSNEEKIGRKLEGIPVRDISQLERDVKQDHPDIAVLTVPADEAQRVLDRVVKTGIKAILNFAPTQLQAPSDVTVKTVNMAMELEGLSYALTNRE